MYILCSALLLPNTSKPEHWTVNSPQIDHKLCQPSNTVPAFCTTRSFVVISTSLRLYRNREEMSDSAAEQDCASEEVSMFHLSRGSRLARLESGFVGRTSRRSAVIGSYLSKRCSTYHWRPTSSVAADDTYQCEDGMRIQSRYDPSSKINVERSELLTSVCASMQEL